jgi:hypothetical protein
VDPLTGPSIDGLPFFAGLVSNVMGMSGVGASA